jgi:signal transduction histidine kinase
MKLRLWPQSLVARTTATLLAVLALVQIAGFTITALDRIRLQRFEQGRHLALRVMELYITVAKTPAEQRAELLRILKMPAGFSAQLSDKPPASLLISPLEEQRVIRLNMALVPMPHELRPSEVSLLGSLQEGRMMIGLRLPQGQWLDITATIPSPRPWYAPGFLIAFVVMTVIAGGVIFWTVRRLIAPVATLAEAASHLGRDLHAPPLPENGPTELARAAAAFNQMAERLRRFVQDRTFLLAAIGHDLRTPITRLRLRAEFIADDELRSKILADLDELETMVQATMAFGRTAASREPLAPIDLAELVRTVLDEVGDSKPELADNLRYEGPSHFTVHARSVALKRAVANLVTNAAAYGGGARVVLHPPSGENPQVRLEIDDDGPGLPPGDIESLFEPFRRGEDSRNRETGGVGLGLTIARDVVREHGGEIILSNRPEGGTRATILLPV